MIGNPPFLGGKLLITYLGEDYVRRMFTTYASRVPAEADLVCYWFAKAGRQIALGKTKRTGLVATNSIRGGANRRALQAATNARRIFDAWSNEPWVIDGAAVRVSLVCFSRSDDESVSGAQLNGQFVDEIYADLTARHGDAGVDLTGVQRLPENANVAFMGDTKGGPFDIAGDQARKLAPPAGKPEWPDECRCPEAVDQRNGPHPAACGEVDRRLRIEDVSRRRGTVRRTFPMGEGTRLPDASAEPPGRPIGCTGGGTSSRGRACGRRSRACPVISPPRPFAKHRLFAWLRYPYLPGLHQLIVIARGRRHDLRHPAQPVSRDLVASARERAWKIVPATRRAPPSRRSRSRPA